MWKVKNANMTSDYKKHLYALVLAGGPGKRLWPLSTEKTPKQFLRLFAGKTLFELTIDRVRKLLPWKRIYVGIVGNKYKEIILGLCPRLPPANIIVEPEGRDSGPAHGLGALYIRKKDPDAVIVNAAADQIIDPEKNYLKAMSVAAEYAYGSKMLIAVGVVPSYAHTGVGYIHKGKKLSRISKTDIFNIDNFTEKPRSRIARDYINSGKHFWNANNYVWRADVYLSALRKHAKNIYKWLELIDRALGTNNEKTALKKYFPKVPKISIDYAISEKAKNFAMIIGEYYWSDVSNWKEVWNNLEKDKAKNAVYSFTHPKNLTILLSAKDNLVVSAGVDVVVTKVKGLVIVASQKGVLITKKEYSQDVKTAVSLLMDKKATLGN